MRKLVLFTLTALMLVSTISAQTEEQLECPSDFVGPGLGPLWEIDKAVDEVVDSPGERAAERAAEACNAVNNNKSNQAKLAIQEHNRIAEVATENDTQGLEKSKQVLEAVRDARPDEANNAGITNAINNVNRAKNRDDPRDSRANKNPENPSPDNVGPSKNPRSNLPF